MALKDLFLSLNGRINRAEFLVGMLGIVAAGLYCFLALETLFRILTNHAIFPLQPEAMEAYAQTGVILFLLCPVAALCAKRMHDWGSRAMIVILTLALAILLVLFGENPFAAMDGTQAQAQTSAWPGYLFAILMLLTLYIALMCFFLPGDEGENRHGPASLKSLGPLVPKKRKARRKDRPVLMTRKGLRRPTTAQATSQVPQPAEKSNQPPVRVPENRIIGYRGHTQTFGRRRGGPHYASQFGN